ncbi:MAG TPA: thioredoxin domain-containing protein [Rhizomicrobium sp.]|jgi:protein-disulfide isomerase
MSKRELTLVAAAGLGGAALAIALVFSAAAFGWLPGDVSTRRYLLAHPEILVDMSTKLQANQNAAADNARQAAIDRLGMKAFFDPKIAFITGPTRAKTTLVEFFDYNCVHCRASLPAVKSYYAAHKDNTRFAFIEFPIKGDESVFAARAAIAARKQPDKYMAFHFLMMGEQNLVTPDLVYADAAKAGLDVEKLKADMANSSVDLAIAAALTLAHAARIDGTPAFIVDGRSWEGEVDRKLLAKFTNTKI